MFESPSDNSSEMKFDLTIYLGVMFCLPWVSALSQQAPYHPLRIKGNIVLDGRLTEPEWQQSEVESDFMQYEPTAGIAPSEKTELKMMYNDQFRIFPVLSMSYNVLDKKEVG